VKVGSLVVNTRIRSLGPHPAFVQWAGHPTGIIREKSWSGLWTVITSEGFEAYWRESEMKVLSGVKQ
jgi:hypothetical protein